MSIWHKLRRGRKGFKQRSSIVDEAASVSSVEDGEDGDDDDDAVVIAGQAESQNVHVFTTVSSIHENPSVKDPAQQGDVSGQPLDCIPSYATKIANDVDVIGIESRFWPRIAKTATLLFVSSGAFYIGKVATVGITLCLLLAFKLSARDRIRSSESSNHTEFDQSDESIPITWEMTYHDGDEGEEYSFKSCIADDDNNGAEMDMEAITYDKDEETFSTNSNGNPLLTKRKQLKRLNCIKIPHSPSPLGEATEESPSSAKASPRTWFRNAGSSMVAGNDTVENSAEIRKQVKLKSKALFRRLRKGEPNSAPSSPLWSDSEAISGISVVSDGSDSERSIHGRPALCRKSKFRPVSPAKEVSEADASVRFLDQRGCQILATGKGENQPTPPLPDPFTAREDGRADSCTAAFCKAKMKQQNISPLLPKKVQSACIPPKAPTTTSGEDMTKLELPALVITTQELPRRRGGRHQYAWKHVAAPVLQETTARRNTALAYPDLSSMRAAIPKRGERKQRNGSVGTAWLTSGLVIITVGLLMGRIVAVAGLVCYWYALSLVKKRTKASENRRQKTIFSEL